MPLESPSQGSLSSAWSRGDPSHRAPFSIHQSLSSQAQLKGYNTRSPGLGFAGPKAPLCPWVTGKRFRLNSHRSEGNGRRQQHKPVTWMDGAVSIGGRGGAGQLRNTGFWSLRRVWRSRTALLQTGGPPRGRHLHWKHTSVGPLRVLTHSFGKYFVEYPPGTGAVLSAGDTRMLNDDTSPPSMGLWSKHINK